MSVKSTPSALCVGSSWASFGRVFSELSAEDPIGATIATGRGLHHDEWMPCLCGSIIALRGCFVRVRFV
jgi:hypothetical protein